MFRQIICAIFEIERERRLRTRLVCFIVQRFQVAEDARTLLRQDRPRSSTNILSMRSTAFGDAFGNIFWKLRRAVTGSDLMYRFAFSLLMKSSSDNPAGAEDSHDQIELMHVVLARE